MADERCWYCDQLGVVDHKHGSGASCAACCSTHGGLTDDMEVYYWVKDCIAAKNKRLSELEWTPIDPSMRFTKHHILASLQEGLSSDDTFVMAYSGGYRTGQDALDDHWAYVKKIDPPITAPTESAHGEAK